MKGEENKKRNKKTLVRVLQPPLSHPLGVHTHALSTLDSKQFTKTREILLLLYTDNSDGRNAIKIPQLQLYTFYLLDNSYCSNQNSVHFATFEVCTLRGSLGKKC